MSLACNGGPSGVVSVLSMKTSSKNKRNGIYADVSGNRPVEKPVYK